MKQAAPNNNEGSNRLDQSTTIAPAFEVDPERGFLPPTDPRRRLPPAYSTWDEVAGDMPKLLANRRLGWAIDRLSLLDPANLGDDELPRAMLVVSFMAHGYVWETWDETPRDHIPPALAVPWYQISRRLGRLPVLSYGSYALDNWRRIDPNGPVALGNVALLQNFIGGLDEEWFVTIHIDIEARAAGMLAAIGPAQAAVAAADAASVREQLRTMIVALEGVYATLARMPEGCDPYIYYNRVRPYLHGFSEHPVIYQGVPELGEQPQRFFGESGAQSTVIPSIDAALGITHARDDLARYLRAMRDYMPPPHRAFLDAVEAGPSIRKFVVDRGAGDPELLNAYDEAVKLVERFRAKHLEYAAAYIHRQSQRGANSTSTGTGGTPFLTYLDKHRRETAEHVLPGS